MSCPKFETKTQDFSSLEFPLDFIQTMSEGEHIFGLFQDSVDKNFLAKDP